MKLFEFIKNFKYIGDGVGKNTLITSVNKNELLVGIAVEMEHTKNLNKSASIAIDHLSERPNYYTLLLQCGIIDEKRALSLGEKLLNIKH